MKTYIQPSIILLMLMSALATLAAPPTLTRVKPENSLTETITIVKGQSITFEVEGSDVDGDISGIDWYSNGYVGTDSHSSSGSVTMKKRITFSVRGEHIVSCSAFDRETKYGNIVKWKVEVVELSRSMWVDYVEGIVGSPLAEDRMIKVAHDHKITGVQLQGFYWLVNKSNHSVWDTFFGKLRANGITYISVVTTQQYDRADRILAYFDDPNVTNKYDAIVTEIEYWGPGDSPFKVYYDMLTYVRNAANARNKAFKVESYITGMPSQERANKICDKVDRIFLSYYTPDITSDRVYGAGGNQEIQYLCNAPNARNLSIRPLFSRERRFMGNYTLAQSEASIFEGFDGDNNLVNKYKPTLDGACHFAYSDLAEDLAELPLRAPTPPGIFTPGENEDTLYIVKNDSIEFTLSGYDYNHGLRGVEWYKNGVRQYTDTDEPKTENTFRRTLKFNETGIFEIYGKLFNASDLRMPEYQIQKRMVQVTDPSKNIARNKKVWQSTTVFGGQAERAIDGNIASAWAGGSITHTSDEDPDTQAWWTIDLSENTHVRFVKIYNRTDACCKNRLSDFYVFASKNVLTRPTVETTKNQANVISRQFSTEAGKGLNIKLDAEVRYIRIQLNTAGVPLNLAEVEVYPKEVKTPTPPDPTPTPTPTPDPTPTPPDPTPTPDPTPPVTGLGQNGNHVKNGETMLYPNPASDKIMVSMPEAVKFEIVNAMGSRMAVPYTRENEMITFDIRQLSPGIYLVLAIEKNNRIKKVLKFIRR